jgi:cytosine/adenosine deaminase-related metal-dependent hydrolase
MRGGPYSSQLTQSPIDLHGARYARGPRETAPATLRIAEGHITEIFDRDQRTRRLPHAISLDGYLLLPGLINAHDHLGFALFPRLGQPPYCNYIEWGEDIHQRYSDAIATHKEIPKETRLWWGGLRNLLCGVTTVSHHDPLWPALGRPDFPVKVVHSNGWAHSPSLGGDLLSARRATPAGGAFVMHACEGTDAIAREELWFLDRLGLLDAATVLVHGLAIDERGAALMRERNVSLIACPSSNHFLFGRLPNLSLLNGGQVVLGSDSPLTAAGDLLDEIRFALRHCGITPESAYCMVTDASALVLRIGKGAGRIAPQASADLVAVRDTGEDPASLLARLSHEQVELVMIDGRVQLASKEILGRLPAPFREGLEPLWMEGSVRWLRAPISKLLREAEEVLGRSRVRLGGKRVQSPA